MCSDGEAVPAHLLILAHASPYLNLVLAHAAKDTQEEAVTLSLPDWDSHTVGQFVSALYQGQLPQGIFTGMICHLKLIIFLNRESSKKPCEGVSNGTRTKV